MLFEMIFEAVVIGVSAGGLYALTHVLGTLPAGFPLPIIVVQHRSRDERFLLEEVLQTKCNMHIKQADEKEAIQPGIVYFAPADYHLLIEKDKTFSLTFDEPVNYSRPSIDILFETAAEVYKNNLLGIILTGANKDGAKGTKCIHNRGGTTIAQRPDSADFPEMPKAAIKTGSIQHVMTLDEIRDYLLDCMKNR
jgi:two-component system, chemotaxis family, protein-glutamate methylesterase/glutaminase